MTRRGDRTVAAAAVATYSLLCLRHRARPGHREERAFRRVNARSDRPWLRLPQQLGTPWTLPATALVLARRGRWPWALAALLALPTEKAAEVATKKLVRRPRPAATVGTEVRDDAPTDGPGQPSGHAAIAAAASYLLARGTGSGTLGLLGAGGTALTSYVRVHQGAHWPADVAAGVTLGVAVAATLASVVAADES
ncbi:phosphatase PAP2 family protein [Nocardioides sp. R1-1]|uniref:phosphatase PAP2 family protein n=1 Tax=Nocardioides sp. R1-1 TaxID=3383502 RepID=UPI0038CF92E8